MSYKTIISDKNLDFNEEEIEQPILNLSRSHRPNIQNSTSISQSSHGPREISIPINSIIPNEQTNHRLVTHPLPYISIDRNIYNIPENIISSFTTTNESFIDTTTMIDGDSMSTLPPSYDSIFSINGQTLRPLNQNTNLRTNNNQTTLSTIDLNISENPGYLKTNNEANLSFSNWVLNFVRSENLNFNTFMLLYVYVIPTTIFIVASITIIYQHTVLKIGLQRYYDFTFLYITLFIDLVYIWFFKFKDLKNIQMKKLLFGAFLTTLTLIINAIIFTNIRNL